MTGPWAFRVKGGAQANWSEVGVSRRDSGRVVVRVGGGSNGVNRSVALTPEQARLLRRYLTAAIKQTEGFRAAADRGRGLKSVQP